MSTTVAKTDKYFVYSNLDITESNAIKAILIWRDLEYTNENIKKINKSEIVCNFRSFPNFAILRNKKDIDKYRKAYTRKTNKNWREATINDIFQAELTW
jgi:hypothetical protein